MQQPLDLGAPREAPREAKKPGFFERITDAIQSQAAKYEGHSSGQAVSGPLTGKPAQSKMTIDRPAAPPQGALESDLDIPAFLRRQAN